MNTAKAKTSITEQNSTPKHAKPKSKTGSLTVMKALVFGPTIAILITTLIYLAWWGLFKAFNVLHTAVTTHFVPWVGANWPIIVGVWALVTATSVVYYFVEQQQKQKKKEKKQTQLASTPAKKAPKKKAPTPTIFDAKADEELSFEELENVGAYPYAPISKAFSTEQSEVKIPEGLEEIIEKVYGTKVSSNQDESFISMGNPSES